MIEKWAQENPSKVAELVGSIHALNYLGYSDEQIKIAFAKNGFSSADFDYIVKEAAVGNIARAIGAGFKGLGTSVSRGGINLARGGQTAMKALPENATMFSKILPGMQTSIGKGVTGLGRTVSGTGASFARDGAMKTLGRGALGFGQGALIGQGKGLGATAGKGVFGYNLAQMFMPGGQSPQVPAPYGQYDNPYGGNPYGRPPM
jgi:hypothetical protein